MRVKAPLRMAWQSWSRVQQRSRLSVSIWALHRPPSRRVWTARAWSTRSLTAAEGSEGSRRESSSNSRADTSTNRSMRSSRGPDRRERYFCTSASEHRHRPEGWPYQPHRQGFMAHTSINRLG